MNVLQSNTITIIMTNIIGTVNIHIVTVINNPSKWLLYLAHLRSKFSVIYSLNLTAAHRS